MGSPGDLHISSLGELSPKPTDGQGNLVLEVSPKHQQWYEEFRGRCKKVAAFDCGKPGCWACHFEKNDGGKRHKTHRERIAHLSYCEQMEEAGLNHLIGHDARFNPRTMASWEQSGMRIKDHHEKVIILRS